MTVFVVTGLPVAALLGTLIVPRFGWRALFVIGGCGALIVWYMRKALPESPRWLESVGKTAEAEALLAQIEKEVALQHSPLPGPLIAPLVKHSRDIATLLSPAILPRMIVGATSLVVINTLLYGFVTWLPTFFVQQGLSIARSFRYSLVMAIGAPIGSAIGAFTADHWGRKRTIVGASMVTIAIGSFYPFIVNPAILMAVGFSLIVPIYVLVALLFAIYIPELFPTEVRLRAAGICNTFGRGAIIFMPFVVVALFRSHGVAGVLAFMIAMLLVQIVVVLTLGVEPKKLRLEEIESRTSVAALRTEVPNP
jgi:putative MFS transporter